MDFFICDKYRLKGLFNFNFIYVYIFVNGIDYKILKNWIFKNLFVD